MPSRLGHAAPVPAPARPRSVAFVERWILPYASESALWPVLVVVLAHVAAFTAPLVLFALRDGSGAAGGVLAALALASLLLLRFEWRHWGRPGALAGMLAAAWLLTAAAAWLAHHYRVF